MRGMTQLAMRYDSLADSVASHSTQGVPVCPVFGDPKQFSATVSVAKVHVKADPASNKVDSEEIQQQMPKTATSQQSARASD